jgi:hypothetical protein
VIESEKAICATLVLDRISVVVTVGMESYKGMLSMMHGYKGEEGAKVWKKKYATYAALPLGNGSSLRIQLGVSHHKLYAQFDFQPPQLNDVGITTMRDYLSIFLSEGVDQFKEHSRVSYAEFAADLHGVAWKGLLPFDDCLRISNWWPSPLQHRPTAYLGRRGANRVIRGYDRAKKVLETEGKVIGGPLTRIEAVCRRTQTTPSTLSGVENPFLTVGIASTEVAFDACTDPAWHSFVYDCRMQGAQVALWSREKAVRQEYLARLKAISVPWWKPVEIWKQRGHALAVLDQVCS